MDTWILIFEVAVLVGFSAICSGLNIALMSLSVAELKRKAKAGNLQAKRVLPLRTNSHLTLASILFTNVAAVSATSLVLESALNGVLAGLIGTLLIVTLGEIVPQSIFSRKALRYCSAFAPLLRVMMFVTYPASKPIQLILDALFGQELPVIQSRRELGILIGEHLEHDDSELDDDEVEIMRGALQLSEKRVRDIMTPIEQVYWLAPDTVIDGAKIDEIKSQARSRIPVFNRHLNRVFGVLLMKDLVDIDFDTTPMRVDELSLYNAVTVGSMTALDTMFRKFIAAHTHLLPVERDDKIVGIVTIEDLLEEILGHEIRDESDRAVARA